MFGPVSDVLPQARVDVLWRREAENAIPRIYRKAPILPSELLRSETGIGVKVLPLGPGSDDGVAK